MLSKRSHAAVAIAAVAGMAASASAAQAVHWPFFGGDNGRSGYQPVDEGGLPLAPVYARTDAAEQQVKTSIVTTTGSPATQRLIFGTRDGVVHFQILGTGAPVGAEAGTSVDEGAADPDVFGTPGTDPGTNGSSVSFADTSAASGLGQLFAVHNDDKADAPDIEIAQFDEGDGGLVQQKVVAGTEGYTVRSSLIATGAAPDGSRSLFFVADDGAGTARLFKVPVANAATRAAGIGDATSTGDIDATALASPTVAFLDVAGTPTPHVLVGAADGLRSFRVSDLGEGPGLVAPGESFQTPSVPVQPSGLTPNPADPVTTAPFIYVAAATMGGTVVRKIAQQGDGSLAAVQTSDELGGTPAPALATDQESEPDIAEAKVVVTTGANLYLLSTADLGLAGQLSRTGRTPGTTGFAQTTAAASGDLGYVTSDDGTQLVFRLGDGKPVAADEFTQAAGNSTVANGGVGQPSLSRGFVQFAGASGVFVFRNTDVTPPSGTLSAPPEGATLTGVVTLTATAFDARGVARVAFRANGQEIGSDTAPDSGSPFGAPGATFSATVDTAALPDGSYLLDAVVTDASGVTTTSAQRRVTLSNGRPAAGEDRPPSVAFTAPSPAANVKGSTTVAATAADDRGVKAVSFFDDDRLICTDTAAPYSCEYTPRGEDVGRDTLFAVAVDTTDQTGAAVRTIRVDRFTPAGLSASVTPSRDRSAPYRFRTSGRLRLPAGVTAAEACEGTVTVRVKAGRKTISTRRASLGESCRYSSRVTFRTAGRFTRSRRLTVSARFLGNDVLTPRRARSRAVRAR